MGSLAAELLYQGTYVSQATLTSLSIGIYMAHETCPPPTLTLTPALLSLHDKYFITSSWQSSWCSTSNHKKGTMKHNLRYELCFSF